MHLCIYCAKGGGHSAVVQLTTNYTALLRAEAEGNGEEASDHRARPQNNQVTERALPLTFSFPQRR